MPTPINYACRPLEDIFRGFVFVPRRRNPLEEFAPFGGASPPESAAASGPRGLRMGLAAACGCSPADIDEPGEGEDGPDPPSIAAVLAAAAADASLPKILSRAARYCASRSARDFCCVSAVGVDDGDGVAGADGRRRMRIAGCSACTGSAAAAEAGAMTTSGMGAFVFLNCMSAGSKEGRVRAACTVQGGARAAAGAVAAKETRYTHASSQTF